MWLNPFSAAPYPCQRVVAKISAALDAGSTLTKSLDQHSAAIDSLTSQMQVLEKRLPSLQKAAAIATHVDAVARPLEWLLTDIGILPAPSGKPADPFSVGCVKDAQQSALDILKEVAKGVEKVAGEELDYKFIHTAEIVKVAETAADTINKALPELSNAAQTYHDAVSSFKGLLADNSTYSVTWERDGKSGSPSIGSHFFDQEFADSITQLTADIATALQNAGKTPVPTNSAALQQQQGWGDWPQISKVLEGSRKSSQLADDAPWPTIKMLRAGLGDNPVKHPTADDLKLARKLREYAAVLAALSGGLDLVELEVGPKLSPEHRLELQTAVRGLAKGMDGANSSLHLWALDLKNGKATSDVLQDMPWPTIDIPGSADAFAQPGFWADTWKVLHTVLDALYSKVAESEQDAAKRKPSTILLMLGFKALMDAGDAFVQAMNPAPTPAVQPAPVAPADSEPAKAKLLLDARLQAYDSGLDDLRCKLSQLQQEMTKVRGHTMRNGAAAHKHHKHSWVNGSVAVHEE